MARKKKEQVAGFNIFQCQLCPDHPQFEAGKGSPFSTHMTEVHGMDMTQQFQKSALGHIDAADWYQWDYEWKHDGVTFAAQSVRNPRHAEDRDYWEGG